MFNMVNFNNVFAILSIFRVLFPIMFLGAIAMACFRIALAIQKLNAGHQKKENLAKCKAVLKELSSAQLTPNERKLYTALDLLVNSKK